MFFSLYMQGFCLPECVASMREKFWNHVHVRWQSIAMVLITMATFAVVANANRAGYAFCSSFGKAYTANPPSYVQIQSLNIELEAERKEYASHAREAARMRRLLGEKERELTQAQRQIDKFEKQLTGRGRRGR